MFVFVDHSFRSLFKMSRKFGCSVCNLKCKTDCIFCKICQSWLHYDCQNIDKADSKVWTNIPLGYICITCRCDDDGSFDFLMGTERIKQAAKQGLKKLKMSVRRESLLLKSHPVRNTLQTDFANHAQDSVANIFLDQYHFSTKAALQSTGDGDCLFNAVSTYLVGNESMSLELRYRCCIEMITNKHKILHHKLYTRLELLSPDYDNDCVDCAKPGSYSSVWRIMALSSLLNIPIESVYPNINGSKHIAFQSLNTTFKPPFADPEKGKIIIMWTNTTEPDKNVFKPKANKRQRKEWTPNHFVPLVDVTRKRNTQFNISSSMMNISETTPTTDFTSPNRFEPLLYQNDNIEMNDSNECEQGNIEKPLYYFEKYQENEEEIVLAGRKNLSTIEEEAVPSDNDISIEQNSMIFNNSYDSVGSLDINVNISATEDDLEDFKAGPLGNKFMDLDTIVNVFKGPYAVLTDIPTGRKDGMYFVVDNEVNVENRKNGKKSEFWDDCGAWKNASTPSSTFIVINNKLTSIVKKQGLYCIEMQLNNKRQYIPIEPQPDNNSILVVHRLYQTLSASPAGKDQFKRRVTWIGSVPDFWQSAPTTVAIVEYIGIFPPRKQHGLTKYDDVNVPYIRTKPAVKKELKEKLSKDTVKNVERIMNRKTNDDNEKQRNDNQLNNIKAALNRESREKKHSNNLADQIISVEQMSKKHEFVQRVLHINGVQHPVVTLYTQQQIEDIKRFCCKEGGCVLNIDKTYNLGDFHVTPTCYKDLSVLRRKTKEHPICFGPTFIHTISSSDAYISFLTHIAVKLSDSEIQSLVIGSDEEYAFKAAIRRCFPGCTHILCTRHLKQNLNKYMEDQVGYPQKDRQQLIDEIFGSNGLIETRDIDTYEKRIENITVLIKKLDSHSNGKKLQPHFDNKFLPIFNEHVLKPIQNNKIHVNWTNNNAESANHILKSAINWKAQELPTFIKTLQKIVDGEQIERARAIRDKGNYQLHSNFIHHKVDIDQWAGMTQEQRDRRTNKFFKDKGKTKQNMVISTDGRRSVLKTPSAGKKPNQSKRKRPERSRTPAKRKIIC